MDFPASPSLNQEHTINGKTWIWNGEGWESKVTDPLAAYTAADVLAKIKTVDGIGSGLDADLLDGQNGTYYLDLANATGTITSSMMPEYTGDVTSPAGSTVNTIPVNSVGLNKLSQIATASILGRTTAGTGNVEVLSVAAAKTLLNLTGTNSGDQTITLTGDVTGSGTGSFAATIASNAVTFAKFQQISTASFVGRNTAGTGNAEVLSVAAAKTLLDLSGTNTGDQTTITGNAGSATVLQTARTIAISGIATGTATSFNGSANISIPVTSLDVGNVGITGILGVDHGGTGIASYTTGNYIYASGATTLAQRTPAQVLSDIGAASTSHNHTLDSLSNVTITANSSGEILRWNGSAWVNSTLAEAGIAAAGSGVTSVNLTSTTGLTASGGPITSSGSLTYTLSANLQAWHGIATATKLDSSAVSAFSLTLLDDTTASAYLTTLGARPDSLINVQADRITDWDTQLGEKPAFISAIDTATGTQPGSSSWAGIFVPASSATGIELVGRVTGIDASRSLMFRSAGASTWSAWTNVVLGYQQVIAGDGLTGGGDLTANRTLTLGTPSTTTSTSTNAVTTTSHTHAITLVSATADIGAAVTSYPNDLITIGQTSGTTYTTITARGASDNRCLQLLSTPAGGSTIPELRFRASHTTIGGGGWTSLYKLWHDGNFAGTLDSLSNVTITSNSSGEILKWNGSAWVNNTLAEAGIQADLGYTPVNRAGDTMTGTLNGTDALFSGSVIMGAASRVIGTSAALQFRSADDTTHRWRLAPTMDNTTNTSFELESWNGTTWVTQATWTPAGAYSIAGNLAWHAGNFDPTDYSLTTHVHSAADITSGTLAVARGGTGIASYTTGNFISASGATTLQQRTPAQVLSDIGAAASGHNHTIASLTDTTITSIAANEILKWNGSAWINNTLAEAGIQPAGSYLTGNQSITLSGDVSGTGTTAITATIGANTVTLAKMADIATASFIGRSTAGTGDPEVLTAAQARTILNVANGATANTGTVTSVSVTTANGVSGSVATSTTTPAISITLGAITPTSVTASSTVSAVGSLIAKGALAALFFENRTNTSETSAWYRSGTTCRLNYSGIGDVVTVDTSGSIVAAGAVTAGGNVNANQNFVSSTTAAVLAATGTGAVYLRPAGAGSTAQQLVLSTGGCTLATDIAVSGQVTAATNFASSGGNVVLAATGAGQVYLRPNGTGSATGQMTVSTAGAVVASGSITAGNGVFARDGGVLYLRPSGAGSGTGQVTVSTSGVVTTNNQVIANGTVRSWSETTSLSGEGVEMYYSPGASKGFVIAFDRTNTQWKTMSMYGLTSEIYASGTLVLNVLTTGIAVTGAITATGNITAYSSDKRLKTNVRSIANATSKLMSIGGYVFDWDKEACEEAGFKPDHETEHGVLAQEIEKVMPDATAPAPFNNDYLTVKYERLTALLIAGFKEQQKVIEELKWEIEKLKGNM